MDLLDPHILVAMRTAPQLTSSYAVKNTENTKEITAIMVYDDLAAGKRAGELISLLEDAQPNDRKFRLQPWRTDFLVDPEWAQVAAAEAVEAELLIVSVSRPYELPREVRNWLSRWLGGRRSADSALVVIVDSKNEINEANISGIEFLKLEAKVAGVNFFSVVAPQHESSNERFGRQPR